MIELVSPFLNLFQGLYSVPQIIDFLSILFAIVFCPFIFLFVLRFFFALFHR